MCVPDSVHENVRMNIADWAEKDIDRDKKYAAEDKQIMLIISIVPIFSLL